MELKPKTTEQIQKDAFVAGNKGRGVEKIRKVISLDSPDSDAVVGMLFGATGSGKTYALAQLALGDEQQNVRPLKLLILSTDMGGNGSRTIRAFLREKKREDLLPNIKVVQADTYEEALDFIKDPYYKLDGFVPDLLVWDGFSFFQLAQLNPYVIEETTNDNSNSQVRDSGLGLDKMDPGWQAMKNGTIQSAQLFFKIRKPDGSPLAKILTATETATQKPVDSRNPMAGSQFVDTQRALLQGQGGQLIKSAFDFIIRCRAVSINGSEDGDRKFEYVTLPTQNLDAKSRNIKLPNTMIANACQVWRAAHDAYGLTI